jgi:uncharacterized RDD family membrane protein YckC
VSALFHWCYDWLPACLQGTAGYRGAVAQQTADAPAKGTRYPGEDLGLPAQGPMSVAGMSRRIAALFVDWLLCLVIARGLTHDPQYWTLVIFAVEDYLLTAVGGITIGKRLLGIRVIRVGGGRIGFGWAALRTLLLLTVILPLFTNRDLRGLHDRAADTVIVRL